MDQSHSLVKGYFPTKHTRVFTPLDPAPGQPLTVGCPLLSALSRVPLVFKAPLAPLGKKESEEPEVNLDLLACLDPLASV